MNGYWQFLGAHLRSMWQRDDSWKQPEVGARVIWYQQRLGVPLDLLPSAQDTVHEGDTQ